MSSVGERIKAAREQRMGLTQRELADQLGVDPVTVSRWERGAAPVSLKRLRQIAALAGIDAGDLISEEAAA